MGVFDGGWFDIGGNLGGRVFLCEKCFAEKTLHFRGFLGSDLGNYLGSVDKLWITFLTFYDFMRIIASMNTDISVEEVQLLHRTSGLWEKHIITYNQKKLLTRWIELALAPGDEILFQFQHDLETVDYVTADLDVMKGKFISVDYDEFEICIEIYGDECAYSIDDVHIHHPAVYAYLSKL